MKQEEKLSQGLRAKLSQQSGQDLSGQAREIAGAKVLALTLEEADAGVLRETMDKLKDKLGSAAIVLASVKEGKVVLVAGVTPDLCGRVPAGELVNFVARQVGGRRGTRRSGPGRWTGPGPIAPSARERGGLGRAAPQGVIDSGRDRVIYPVGDPPAVTLIVQKFGGTSVGDIDRIRGFAALVGATRALGHEVVVVVSAMSGETDRLIGLARKLTARPNARETMSCSRPGSKLPSRSSA